MKEQKVIPHSIDDLTVIAEEKLKKDRFYYHCAGCGVVYADKERTQPLINMYALTGVLHIPKPFTEYYISTGYDAECLKEYCAELEKNL